jgi:hypothetical protein
VKRQRFKEMAVAYLKILSKDMPGETEENCKNHHSEKLVTQSQFEPNTNLRILTLHQLARPYNSP